MGWGLSCPSLSFPLAGPRRTAPGLHPVATLGLPKVSLDSNTGTHMEEQARGTGQTHLGAPCNSPKSDLPAISRSLRSVDECLCTLRKESPSRVPALAQAWSRFSWLWCIPWQFTASWGEQWGGECMDYSRCSDACVCAHLSMGMCCSCVEARLCVHQRDSGDLFSHFVAGWPSPTAKHHTVSHSLPPENHSRMGRAKVRKLTGWDKYSLVTEGEEGEKTSDAKAD